MEKYPSFERIDGVVLQLPLSNSFCSSLKELLPESSPRVPGTNRPPLLLELPPMPSSRHFSITEHLLSSFSSPWRTPSLARTMPISLLIGFYLWKATALDGEEDGGRHWQEQKEKQRRRLMGTTPLNWYPDSCVTWFCPQHWHVS